MTTPTTLETIHTLTAARQFDEAAKLVDRLLLVSPNDPDAHFMRAVLYNFTWQPEAAERHLRVALALAEDVRYWEVLAFALNEQERYDEAVAAYERMRALGAPPEELDTYIAMCRLAQGDYQTGLVLNERRLVRPNRPFHDLPAERWWRGGRLDGGKLVVMCEQGLGDVLQFARYLPALAGLDGVVEFYCYQELLALLAPLAPGPISLQRWPEDPAAKVVAIGSLPLLLGPEAGRKPPYLSASPGLVQEVAGRMAGDGLRVGVAWCGNPDHPRDFVRSCEPELLAGLARVPGVTLYGLQPNPSRPPLPEMAPLIHTELAPLMLDFAHSAAVLTNLDLVITVDTSVVHLAGALGVPTWLALSPGPDWRWERRGSISAWYPSVRLWRQTTRGQWGDVFAAMEPELAALARAKAA